MLSQVIKLYEDRGDVTLTTYVLADSPEMLKGAKRPAVLICPGGAYLGCSDREGEPVAMRFAAMGYHAFVLRYSTFFQGELGFPAPGQLPERKEHCIHPNPMREIGKAMLIIHEHAEAWKVDTTRIALCGFSAGAHNSAMYSVYWNTPVMVDHFGVPAEQLKPAATILAYGLSDYFLMKENSGEGMAKDLFALANLALMGTPDPEDALLDAVSPALHVTADTPPMFLWATAADELVPVENTLRMATALTRQHIPYELHVFEAGMHGLSLADQSTASCRDMMNADAAKWVSLAESWLQKRFALELPEHMSWG